MNETTTRPQPNGLGPQVAAVEAARERLGRDLDQLTVEVRATMGQKMEEFAWKGAATATAVLAGIAARNAVMTGWKKVRKTAPPNNPAAPDVEWMEALAWSVATGIAVGLARLIATRGAAEGWRRYMGALPPGLQEVS